MKLTPKRLRACYDFIRILPPFLQWNMPDGYHVDFVVSKSRKDYGSYHDPEGRDTITISGRLITSLAGLMTVMAHEMVHLADRRRGTETPAQHGKTWIQMARKVCREFEWDYGKGFK